jgi:PAS domain S-box-containing protein
VSIVDGSAPDGAAVAREITRIIAERDIVSLYQPIVDLRTGDLIGCEVLSRGPVGSPLHDAGSLFGAAARVGLLPELDLLCRVLGLSRARDAGGAPGLVFVNVEPGDGLELSTSDELTELLGDLPFQVVVEFTERALTRRPADLLRYTDGVHFWGNLVAIDDLGADPHSLALVPLLKPDIAKLDIGVVQGTSPSAGVTAAAVWGYAGRTGAVVLAEGIETEAHRARALALGATWGQGYLFGRPAPIEAIVSRPRAAGVVLPWPVGSPRAAVDKSAPTPKPRLTSRLMLAVLSRHGSHGVILMAVERDGLLTRDLLDRYAGIARSAALVGIIGPGVSVAPATGVHGGDVPEGCALSGQWAVVVVGPDSAQALLAVPDPDVPDCYQAIITTDRAFAAQLADRLTRQLTPTPAGPPETRAGCAEAPHDDASPAVEFSSGTDDTFRSGWMRKDHESIIIEADAGVSALLGYPYQDLVGLRTLDLIHPDDRPVALQAWREMLSAPGRRRRVRLRHLRADGSYLWCEVTNHNALYDPEGCVRCEILDVHAEVANERELASRERTLHILAETLPVGVVLVDADGRIAYANEQMRSALTPLTRATIQDLFAAVDPADRESAERAYVEALSTEQPVRATVRVGLPGGAGDRLFRLDINASGEGRAVACATDVTADNRLREKLERQATRDSLTGCLNRAAILRVTGAGPIHSIARVG